MRQLEQFPCQIIPLNMQHGCAASVTAEGEFHAAELNAKILTAFPAGQFMRCIMCFLGNKNNC